MEKILSDNIEELQNLCQAHKVSQLYVFGSVCTDRFSPSSDIDFLVDFQPMEFGDYTDNYFQFCEALEKLFKRKADVVTFQSLSNPYFIKTVNRTKKLIYNARRDQEVMLDIQISANSIEDYLGQSKNFNEYKANKMLRRAVEREFEIIREALNRLSKLEPDIKISQKSLITGMRNRVIHGYDKIDDEIIWGAIIRHLPTLREEVNLLMKV